MACATGTSQSPENPGFLFKWTPGVHLLSWWAARHVPEPALLTLVGVESQVLAVTICAELLDPEDAISLGDVGPLAAGAVWCEIPNPGVRVLTESLFVSQ